MDAPINFLGHTKLLGCVEKFPNAVANKYSAVKTASQLFEIKMASPN